MNILADSNIPFIAEACAGLGELRSFDASDREGLRILLREADALLCRSTVSVDADLLHDSPLRFVATATAGVDHVDQEYLRSRGIAFASAAGNNAQSVAEYVFAALLRLAVAKGIRLEGASIGVIGVGQVGSRVAAMAQRLGMTVIRNDPPRQEAEGGAAFRPLEEALEADIVTLHVPLTDAGPHPTRGLLSAAAFARMRPGAVFVNAARGEAADADALLRTAAAGRFAAVVADVFPGEPAVDVTRWSVCDIITPHIAGHSFDAKLRGTRMVTDALFAFLGRPSVWREDAHAPGGIPLSAGDVRPGAPPLERAHAAVAQAYDITRDDAALRSLAPLTPADRARAFHRLRADYPVRREFSAWHAAATAFDAQTLRILRALGFD